MIAGSSGSAVILPPLIEGRLLRRYKRFLADVELSDGSVVVAHCPNPGSMKTMKDSGCKVWLSASDNPKRRLAYTWELVLSQEALTLVHTGRANAIVEEGLRAGVVEPLSGFTSLRREVRYGEKSRLDFQLQWHDKSCFVEVKNVTMADGPRRCAFPDSVTARGTKHLRELMSIVSTGQRAVLLFCCSRAGTRRIRPADEIDSVYGATLREAAKAGVEIMAYACEVKETELVLAEAVPVELDSEV
jgi:sugar fermentation stimulation protein A